MNRKTVEFTLTTVVAIMIALIVLAIILGYIFLSPGGPSKLINSLLGFMGNQTAFVKTTTSNI